MITVGLGLPVAHIAHWWEQVLYALPIVIVAVAIWRTARKGGEDGEGDEEFWEGADDPQWSSDDWDDPRLRDG